MEIMGRELEKEHFALIALVLFVVATFLLPKIGAPSETPIVGMLIVLGVFLVFLVKHENFSIKPLILKIEMIWTLFWGGFGAIVVFAIQGNMINDFTVYIGDGAISFTTLLLAVIGIPSLGGFLALLLTGGLMGYKMFNKR